MSSEAIMAIIKQKEEELEKIKTSKTHVSKLNDAVDCMSYKFKNAGSLMSEVGTIAGMPIDNGATSVVAGNFKKILSNTQGVLTEIINTIIKLETEIQALYQQYYQAKAAEEAEAELKVKKVVSNAEKSNIKVGLTK